MPDDCIEAPEANKYSLRKRLKMPILMRAMTLKNNDIVLDVGCGAGIFSAEMAKRAKKVYGLDYSDINVNAIKKRYSSIKNLFFRVGDAVDMPFKDNTFDAILATEIMEHIEDDKKFVSECYRVLKKGGRLIVTTPCTNPSISIDWFRRLSGINMNTAFGHKRAGYTKKEIYKIFKNKGFKPLYSEYYDQFFGELAWVFTCIPRILIDRDKWSKGEDQINVGNSFLFKVYKKIFPLIFVFAKLDILIKWLRGHHILIKAMK